VFTSSRDKKGEPTSGLEPLTCSFRVRQRAFLGIAGGCKTRISKPFSLLCLAQCCRVLRSRGCQSVMIREQARRTEAGLSGPARSCPRLPLCRIALRPVSSALQISHRARSLSPSLPLRVSHSLYSYMPFRFFPDENRANSCKSVTYFSTRARRRSSTSMAVMGIKTDFEPKRPPILTLTYSGSSSRSRRPFQRCLSSGPGVGDSVPRQLLRGLDLNATISAVSAARVQ
jgi:hypothetical protein